ncbi:unnamed protein product, partial [Adineta ricciae]
MCKNPQTKLFKFICKQVAVMREPYRKSSWTESKISKPNKTQGAVFKKNNKSACINKMEQVIRPTAASNKKECISTR